MKNEEYKGLDFGGGSIRKLFRVVFFPTLAAMVFDALFVMVDGIFVGHGIGASGIAAISIVSPLFAVVSGTGLMFGIGASVLASISLSRKCHSEANNTVTQAFTVGTLLMLVVAVTLYFFAENIVSFLGGSATLQAYSVRYLCWLLPGVVFLMLQYVGMMLIRLDGSPKYAMLCNVIPGVINVFLDWLFIFPLGLGLKGAAMATSVSCILGGSMALFYFLRLSEVLRFTRLRLAFSGLADTLRNTASIMKIGFATLLTELAMSVMLFTANKTLIKMLGDNGVAAFSVACYLFPFLFSVNNAVAEAVQPIVSFNFGAGDMARVKKALRTAVVAALICGIIEVVAISGGARYLVMMFLASGTEPFELACAGLPEFALCGIFFALNIVFIGYFQSVKESTKATVFTLLRGMIFVVPCLRLLPELIGISGFWLAIPVSEALTLLVIFLVYCANRK
ncbi:MAG: MATE family efflux transporter [Bacteroides sp.]|nr:MATE family efflux transporter [Roseburia sp.]MCM1345627.1 MATE family efflux transporter [Bacteroides sp.]MCM1420931.1 MATE family efflux transporter [Bacteroides sp.]